MIATDLKELTGHHFIAFIIRNGKNSLFNYFPETELRNYHRLRLFNIRKIREILTGFSCDAEARLFTTDQHLEISVGFDGNIIVRKLSYDFGKNLGVNGNDSFFPDISFDHGFNTQLHIVGCHFDLSCRCIN